MLPSAPIARPRGALNVRSPAVRTVTSWFQNASLLGGSHLSSALWPVSATHTLPAASTATAVGSLIASRSGETVTVVMYLPVALNSSTRLLPVSATHTSPFASSLTPRGALSWPGPLPAPPPILRTYLPTVVNSCTRLLLVSAT